MMPSIGTLSLLPTSGRLGLVVGAQAVGAPQDGRQLMALKIKAVDGAGGGKARPPEARPSETRPADAQRQPVRPRAAPAPSPDRPPEASGQRPSVAPGPDAGRAAETRSYDRLSSEERAVVDRLRQRDSQVRQEEEAHAAVAGDLAGPIAYVYQRGPDGRLYAVGGSVPIKAQVLSGDPEAAKRLGARIAAAAHAATNPSAADLAAANRAYRLLAPDTVPDTPGAQDPERAAHSAGRIAIRA